MNINILYAALAPIVAILLGLLYIGIGRKIIARLQRRYGPPFYQQYIDTIKLLAKKTVSSHGVFFSLGPIMGLAGSMVTLLFIPFGSAAPLLSFHGDIILVMYLVVIAPLGMALGVGEGSNPNGSIGMARGLTLMLAYEVPFVLALFSVVLYTHTTSIAQIVQSQAGEWSLLKFHGFNWLTFALPISAIVADICLQGMLGEKPFDQVIAPHEIASGPMVEYGGKYLGMMVINHALHIYIETALFVDIFLGGGPVWFFIPATFSVFILSLIINGVLPRFRIGQALKFYWGVPLILAVIGIIYTMVVIK